jgi:hypothetical protein
MTDANNATLQRHFYRHFDGIFTGVFVIKFDSVNIPLVESRVGLSLSQKYKTKMEVAGRD